MAHKRDCSLISFSMNDDALMEILLRLPAKSLIRFKSVCKKWRTLISSDYFCHRHTLLRPKPQPSLLLHVPSSHEFFYFNHGEKTIIPYTLYIKSSSLDLDPNHLHKIVQACNGLVLLVSKRYVDYPPIEGAKWAVNFYDVYNPTTKQSREMSLAFDPWLSPYYKIVCIRSTRELDPYSNDQSITFQIEVYDSESHSWKVSVEAVPAVSLSSPRGSGVHWNNSIYWRSKKKYCCFDIGKNEITTVPFPQTSDIIGDYCHVPYLQECNGHLYHFEWIWKAFYDRGVIEPADQSIAVWELGGNNEWLFKYYHTLGDDDSKDVIIGLVRSDGDGDGDEACSLLSYSQAGKMKAYNFINKTCEDLFQFKTNTSSVLGFQFGEVLALV